MNYLQSHKYNFIHSCFDPRIQYSNEPTFLAFSLEFNFESLYSEYEGFDSNPLLTPAQFGAYHFLKSRGLDQQAKRAESFSKRLKFISTQMPWFFQSISGINDLWEGYTDMSKPNKGDGKKLTVDTLESLDFSITELAALYRDFTYDGYFMRHLLPDNLRWFTMSVYIHEFRNLMIDETDSDYKFAINKNQYLRWDLEMCEFDFSQTVPINAALNVNDPVMATNKFSIKYGNYKERHRFGLGAEQKAMNNENQNNRQQQISGVY